MKNTIEFVDIKNISSHPKNPRKNLGELDELAESIKANGIMQNLTIIPWYSTITGVGADDPKQQEEMGYYVVIGHRRLAAAKLAGLEKVPCIIGEMDEKQQLATMLFENMQRCNLTIIEEAEGIQMMLDLGSTASEISEQTGLSKSTIKRRTNLLELDRDKLYKSHERGGALQDYMELDKIKDLKVKNKILEFVGTSNFQYELKRAIDNEKHAENRKKIIVILDTFAKKLDERQQDLSYIEYISLDNSNLKVPVDAETRKYFYLLERTNIILYAERVKSADGEAKTNLYDVEREKLQAKKAKLDEISKRMFKLRYDFVLKVSPAAAKKNIAIIIKYILKMDIADIGDCFYDDMLKDILNISDDEELTYELISEPLKKSPEKMLLISTYSKLDSSNCSYHTYNGEYDNDDNELNLVYDFLGELEYQISDEEIAIKSGTHELYKHE